MMVIYPHLFYRQDWYVGEDFMERECAELDQVPHFRPAYSAEEAPQLYFAGTLAGTYIRHPEADIWQNYIWTADVDQHGQRVYVGGLYLGKGLQIHRHIHITERFGVAA